MVLAKFNRTRSPYRISDRLSIEYQSAMLLLECGGAPSLRIIRVEKVT
jgi:hypothetical protein